MQRLLLLALLFSMGTLSAVASQHPLQQKLYVDAVDVYVVDGLLCVETSEGGLPVRLVAQDELGTYVLMHDDVSRAVYIKVCPICRNNCSSFAKTCWNCDHEF